MPEDQHQQIAQGRIIREIIKRVPWPFPVNKPDEFEGNPPKSLDQPSANEKKFRELLNADQKKAIKNSQYQDDDIRYVDDPTRDRHGCVQADLLIRNGTSAHELAVAAMTGDITPNIIVTPKGGIAVFDAKFSNHAPQRFNSDKGSMWEVEHIIPTNAAERAAAQSHLTSKVAHWNHQGKIANACGYQFKVGIADQGLYEWANQNLKVNPGIQIVQRSIAGSYSEVRAETVGGQVHHTPAADAQRRAGTMRSGGPVTYRSAPGMWMLTRDHIRTRSHPQEPFDDEYRDAQRDAIKAGQSEQAYRMDVRDIQSKFPDGKYTHILRQLEQHIQRDRTFDRINQDVQNRQSSIETPQNEQVAARDKTQTSSPIEIQQEQSTTQQPDLNPITSPVAANKVERQRESIAPEVEFSWAQLQRRLDPLLDPITEAQRNETLTPEKLASLPPGELLSMAYQNKRDIKEMTREAPVYMSDDPVEKQQQLNTLNTEAVQLRDQLRVVKQEMSIGERSLTNPWGHGKDQWSKLERKHDSLEYNYKHTVQEHDAFADKLNEEIDRYNGRQDWMAANPEVVPLQAVLEHPVVAPTVEQYQMLAQQFSQSLNILSAGNPTELAQQLKTEQQAFLNEGVTPSLQAKHQMQKIIKAADDSPQTQEMAVADAQMALG